MKTFQALIFLLVFHPVFAQDLDVLHYQYSITLTDRSDTIAGESMIRFVQKTGHAFVELDLVSPQKNGKGMKVSSVRDRDKKELNFSQSAEKIRIDIPSIQTGDTSTLFIRYHGIPANGLIISKNKYGGRTFFSDNWPDRAHHWIPCNDRPDDKASFEFIVTAPSHYRVISNGVFISENEKGKGSIETHWKEIIPQPTKVMVIGAALFAVKTFASSPKDIPISAWVYPQDSAKGFYDYALAPSIVQYFENYIGPYPYKKLANVQSKTMFGGMENASAIFYSENSVTGTRESEDLLAHEIAHQWFGNMASEKSFSHLWLSEGFATYLTNIYLEQKYGQDKMWERLEEDRKQVVAFATKHDHPVVDSSCSYMDLLNANSYQKGGWVLHMLRNEVGNTSFQKILQTYYDRFKGGNADTRDFEAVVEEVTGKEMTWFFDQWLYRTGIPDLKMETKIQDDTFHLYIKQKDDVYRFPLEVHIVLEDGELMMERFEVSEKESEFKVPVKGTSVRFSIDPDVKLLYRLRD